MKSKYFAITLILILSLSVTGTGKTLYDDLNITEKRDEPLDYTLNKRFSSQNAYFRLGQIKEFVKSSITLMKKHAQGIPVGEVNKYEMSLDFELVNWSKAIEGTLKKQDYVITKLQYELAQERYEAGKINEEALNTHKQKYIYSKKDFEKFFNSFRIID